MTRIGAIGRALIVIGALGTLVLGAQTAYGQTWTTIKESDLRVKTLRTSCTGGPVMPQRCRIFVPCQLRLDQRRRVQQDIQLRRAELLHQSAGDGQ